MRAGTLEIRGRSFIYGVHWRFRETKIHYIFILEENNIFKAACLQIASIQISHSSILQNQATNLKLAFCFNNINYWLLVILLQRRRRQIINCEIAIS
jgi:hypothetical protein